MSAARDIRIDALRALALAGILQVNIQSFVWGAGNPLGYLVPGAGALDHAVWGMLALLVEYKFMPIFALLFGAGLGLYSAQIAAAGADPRPLLRRRMGWLLAIGVAHGLLLYYGDITHTYALLGFLLLRHLASPLARLRRALALWWGLALLLPVVFAIAMGAGWESLPPDAEQAAALRAAFHTYTTQGWLAQLPLRAADFGVLVASVWLGGQWLATYALILTGLYAQRAGWFAAGPAFWRRVLVWGLVIGLPASAVSAALLLADADAGPAMLGHPWRAVVMSLAPAQALAYVAAFWLWAPAGLLRFLAPVGRMPLTNYLLQSLLMGALLSGWGLGWGAWLGTAQLAALAAAIVVLQWVLSAAWMRGRAHGPVEELWRWLARAGVRAPPVA